MWAQECCRISPRSFLAECRKKRLNWASSVWLFLVFLAFSGLCLVFVVSVLICLSSIFQLVPHCIINCADVLIKVCSQTHCNMVSSITSVYCCCSWGMGYRGGSPTAIQAWQPCPLWELSPSHPILL